ncbi:replication initiation protein [Paraphotobacterium marinum]
MRCFLLNALDIFKNRLHEKTYSTNEIETGCKIRYTHKATHGQRSIDMRYIQPNTRTHVYYLVFDMDQEQSAIQFEKVGAPAPNIITINPHNARSHQMYSLETSVRVAHDGSRKAIDYYMAVYQSLHKKLGADVGYKGFLCKNPLHDCWKTWVVRNENYTLDELSDYLDLNDRLELDDVDAKRNCNTFDYVRNWAYTESRKTYVSPKAFERAVLEEALKFNSQYTEPMNFSEVKAIAKSVSRFVERKYTSKGFSDWCARKGKIGGQKSKRKPVPDSENTTKPWLKLGIGKTTYYKRKKEGLL